MSSKHEVIIDGNRCIGCWECAKDCPNLCLSVKHGKAVFDNTRCIACGHCLAICPQAAISMTGFGDEDIHPVSSYQPDPDALLDAMRSRRSVRRFQKRPIPRALLEKLIQAGRYSATARNKQGLHYVVLTDALPAAEDEALRYFRDPQVASKVFYNDIDADNLADDFFFKGATAVILINGRNKIDAALAASKIETLALAMGLGVFYSGFFVFAAEGSFALRRLLGLSEQEKPAVALVLGYPDVHYMRTAPREKAEVTWL